MKIQNIIYVDNHFAVGAENLYNMRGCIKWISIKIKMNFRQNYMRRYGMPVSIYSPSN